MREWMQKARYDGKPHKGKTEESKKRWQQEVQTSGGRVKRNIDENYKRKN